MTATRSRASLTGTDNYFEDFPVGRRFRHARGKTVSELENVLLTNLVMNTADVHFNDDVMRNHPLGQRIVFGGVTAALVIGLASQDTSDNALADHGIADLRLLTPVVHGDTLYAYTEVLTVVPTAPAVDLGGEEAGTVTFHHWGVNQRGDVVLEVDRTVSIRRRPTLPRSIEGRDQEWALR